MKDLIKRHKWLTFFLGLLLVVSISRLATGDGGPVQHLPNVGKDGVIWIDLTHTKAEILDALEPLLNEHAQKEE